MDWTGYSREGFASHRLQELLTPGGRIFYETQCVPLLQLQGVVKAVAFDLVRSDSTILPVLLNAVQRKNVVGTPLIHFAMFDATDRRTYERELLRGQQQLEKEVARRTSELALEISERKQAEQNLRQLTAALLRLRDDEQRRLARDLHDSVGQLLAGISMNQAAITRDKEKLGERARAALAENVEMIDQILTEIRTISHLLHPPLLDDVGLASALRWYIDGINNRSKLSVELEVEGEFGRLPAEMETTLFRVAQECLTNIHRHAMCEHATVSLQRFPDFVSLTVADQGTGMPPEKIEEIRAGRTGGVGLPGMAERVRQLRGVLDLTSSEEGTVVAVRLPIVSE